MATAATVALRPKNEAPRRSWQTKRGTTNVISSNASEDNLTLRRTQRLVEAFGLSAARARLVADLAWGTAHG